MSTVNLRDIFDTIGSLAVSIGKKVYEYFFYLLVSWLFITASIGSIILILSSENKLIVLLTLLLGVLSIEFFTELFNKSEKELISFLSLLMITGTLSYVLTSNLHSIFYPSESIPIVGVVFRLLRIGIEFSDIFGILGILFLFLMAQIRALSRNTEVMKLTKFVFLSIIIFIALSPFYLKLLEAKKPLISIRPTKCENYLNIISNGTLLIGSPSKGVEVIVFNTKSAKYVHDTLMVWSCYNSLNDSVRIIIADNSKVFDCTHTVKHYCGIE